MSKNSKNARQNASAKKYAELHKKGEKGPSQTQPRHGKKKAWWQMFPSYGAYLRNQSGRRPVEAE